MAIGYGRLTPVRKAGSTIGRSAHHGGHRLSHGAGGRAAYLSADKVVNNDLAMVTDYIGKFGVEHSELVLPGGGTTDREKFWNSVDAHKTQSPNATVARDLIVAFPHEFSLDERKSSAKELATWIAERYHVAVDYGLHLPETQKGSSEKNFHGHFLISERTVSPTGELGKVQRELNQMVCQQIDEKRGRMERKPTAAKEIRLAWERIANDTLERGGHVERIDMHTRNRIPSKHLGASETTRLRESGKEKSSEIASEFNADKGRDLKSALQLTKEIDGLQRELERKVRHATQQIEVIQERRRTHIEADVQSHIGGLDAWAEDAAGQFGRAWKSEDRAQRIRKRIREIEETRRIMREPTVDEAAELTSLGRMRSRSNTLLDRSERVAEKLGGLDQDIKFDIGNGPMTKKRLTKVEAEVDRHLEKQRARSRDAGFGLEIEL